MDDTKVLIELKSFVVSCGSQKEAAKSLGISTQYLNDLLRGRRNVSEEIAGKFGYKAEWVANGERLLTRRAVDEMPCPLDHKELSHTGTDVCPECHEVTASRK